MEFLDLGILPLNHAGSTIVVIIEYPCFHAKGLVLSIAFPNKKDGLLQILAYPVNYLRDSQLSEPYI
jgi:hypothetical protein